MKKLSESMGKSEAHRKDAAAALRESEENFRTFFTTVDDMILVGSPEGRIVYANPAVSRKLGYSPIELEGMHILELHPAEKRREAEAIFASMFRGELDVCPLPLQSKTGVLIPVETRAWFGKWSGVDCIFGISKDLTREQEALQKFNRLFGSNPLLMAVSRLPERTFTDINDAFQTVLGYTREEVLGKTSEELGLFVQPEEQQKVLEQLLARDRISDCELRVRCKDGTIRDGLFSGELIENQGIKYLLTVMVDQTERKQTETELGKFRERLEDIVKEKTAELESKNTILQELNTTLRVLLRQREEDKKEMEERFVLNIRDLVLPFVERLKRGSLDTEQHSLVGIIEAHLHGIAAPMLKKLKLFSLTPREIQVAALVRQGMPTKEIAAILRISVGSIDIHRKNIRKKIGLNHRKANLASSLSTFEQ